MFLLFLKNAIRFSTVFLFGSTGETITEKSGHLNLGIPGIMCLGGFGGYLGEYLYMSSLSDASNINGFLAVFIPIIFALIFGGLGGLLFSFFAVTLRCNQNVTGLTLTTFGVGLANFVGSDLPHDNFNIASTYFRRGFVVGDGLNWFEELFLSHGTLVYLAIIVAILVFIVFNKTRVGLNLRAVGENPATADAAGINVTKYRYIATITGSAIAGLGGLFYIMDYIGGIWQYAIEGLGWLAVALVIFSVWKPNWGILGSIVFGMLYIAPNYINYGFKSYICAIFELFPYIVTVLSLIVISFFNKRETQPPMGLGMTYFREDR